MIGAVSPQLQRIWGRDHRGRTRFNILILLHYATSPSCNYAMMFVGIKYPEFLSFLTFCSGFA